MNLGIVSLEDLIESILGMEIEDESDSGLTKSTTLLKQSTLGRSNLLERFARRQLPESLTPQETTVVIHHLRRHTALFDMCSTRVALQTVKRIVASAKIFNVQMEHPPLSSLLCSPVIPKKSADLSFVEVGGHSLYLRGVESGYLTLIIEGNAIVNAGIEDFIVPCGNWTLLGNANLNMDVNAIPSFIPDFSATLTTSSRLLRISRQTYLNESLATIFDGG